MCVFHLYQHRPYHCAIIIYYLLNVCVSAGSGSTGGSVGGAVGTGSFVGDWVATGAFVGDCVPTGTFVGDWVATDGSVDDGVTAVGSTPTGGGTGGGFWGSVTENNATA